MEDGMVERMEAASAPVTAKAVVALTEVAGSVLEVVVVALTETAVAVMAGAGWTVGALSEAVTGRG